VKWLTEEEIVYTIIRSTSDTLVLRSPAETLRFSRLR
jgi:hypothetical protein